MTEPLDRLRAICLALPEASERETWGEATFRIRDKIFAMAGDGNGKGRLAMSCKARAGLQAALVEAVGAQALVERTAREVVERLLLEPIEREGRPASASSVHISWYCQAVGDTATATHPVTATASSNWPSFDGQELSALRGRAHRSPIRLLTQRSSRCSRPPGRLCSTASA